MNNVIYHVVNRRKVLAEVYRCLQPGGIVYFADQSPSFYDGDSRPFVRFIEQSGGRNFARKYTRKRSTMYMQDRTINPLDLISAGGYVDLMRECGFTNVSARYLMSDKLLRLAYNSLDMGFIFGTGALSPKGATYRDWVRSHLVYELLQDEIRCRAEDKGGYIFVVAKKPA